MNAGAKPYSAAVDLLDDEFRWIRARAQRIAFERGLVADAKFISDDDRLQLKQLREAEEQLRRQIDARLLGSEQIGVDELVSMFDLVADERLILVTLAIPALDLRQGEDLLRLLDENSAPFGRWDIATVSLIIDPAHKSVRDMVRIRHHFRREAALVRERLVSIGASRETLPEDFPTRSVALTYRALKVIVGDRDMDEETGEGDDYGP